MPKYEVLKDGFIDMTYCSKGAVVELKVVQAEHYVRTRRLKPVDAAATASVKQAFSKPQPKKRKISVRAGAEVISGG